MPNQEIPFPTLPHHANADLEMGRLQYEEMGVFHALEKYGARLSWGRGQTMALLDDSCDLTIPEWQVEMPWGPKIAGKWNSVECNDDPSPISPAYHGTSMGFPSSLYFESRGGLAFQDFMAPVRCVRRVFVETRLEQGSIECDEMFSIVGGLRWVLENRGRLNITAVNLAVLDGGDPPKHRERALSEIDEPLRELRELGIWVSAPCGNSGSSEAISWPAASPHCFAIGGPTPDTSRTRTAISSLT